MLVFNLKSKWYDKINSGEKSHEYREVKPYWTKRIENFIRENLSGSEFSYPFIEFRKGYPKKDSSDYFVIKVKSITIVNGLNTDLKIDKPVYDIELDLATRTF